MNVIYFKQGRREPVRMYIDNLAEVYPDAAAKVIAHIEVLAAEGTISKNISCRSMGKHLWELRIKSKDLYHRVFFCIAEGTIWLLHAFSKKSSKTPKNELETANKRLKEVYS